jgi:16S rRNA (uracil1498-N3)-methyltransferase
MRRFFVQDDFIAETLTLPEEESKHISKVLRMQVGNTLELVNGKGFLVSCEIIELTNKKTKVKVIEKEFQEKKSNTLNIAISPTKNMDRMEWFVEKSVEVGIDSISLIQVKHTERNKIRIDRLEKRAISALKQSKGLWLPEIKQYNNLIDFTLANNEDIKLVAHCYADKNRKHVIEAIIPKQSCCIMIGPEGDFTEEEVDILQKEGYSAISLGKNRLRTETAAIFVCNAFHFVNFKA